MTLTSLATVRVRRFNRSLFQAIALAIFASSLLFSPVSKAQGSDDLKDLGGYIAQALEDWRTPGMTVTVVRGDETIHAAGYGVVKQGSAQKVDARTLFALGSTSKAFAAATTAVLVSRGEIEFDDRVKKYLPWFEIYDPELSQLVTVRDLLVQRIGTSYADENKLRPGSKDARHQLERSAELVKPIAGFRDRYVYSNNMFIASGEFAAAVSGKPWPDFARDAVWAPLGMSSTNADASLSRQNRNAAWPHDLDDNGAPAPFVWKYPDAVAVPSGGVNSNAVDMANWLKFQLAEGAVNGEQLIARDVFRQMHLPQTAITNPGDASDIGTQFPDPIRDQGRMRFWSYGMGWYVTEYRGRKLVYHSGSINGFRAGVAMLPEENLAVYVGVNRVSRLPFPIILRIFDELLQVSPGIDWSQEYLSLE